MDQNEFYQTGTPTPAPAPEKSTNWKAVIALILGIVSIVGNCIGCCGLFFVGIICLACAIAGIVLAVKSKKDGKMNGCAIGGIICSVVGLILSVINIVLFIFVVAALGSPEFINTINEFLEQESMETISIEW